MVAQAMKVTHQAALDEGDWRLARRLNTLRDPLQRTRFGGTEKELECIAAYPRAMKDLESRMRREKGRDEHHAGDDDKETPKRRGMEGAAPQAAPR